MSTMPEMRSERHENPYPLVTWRQAYLARRHRIPVELAALLGNLAGIPVTDGEVS